MTTAQKIEREADVLLDYISPDGPTTTFVRGTMLVNSLANLRELGLFSRYAELLPAERLNEITYTLASGWVRVQLLSIHYAACDALAFTPAQIAQAGELSAQRLSKTFFGHAIRFARSGGLDGFATIMANSHRLHQRLYLGGGCLVVATGPKDLRVETMGMPFQTSPYFRDVYLAYFRVACALFCRVGFVKYVRPSRPQSLAIGCSWV